MNKTIKTTVAALSLALTTTAFAFDEETEELDPTDAGAIGWTSVAVSLASPVQLPWGIGIWDVFGFDIGIFYNDVCRMYGIGFALANTTRDDVMGLDVGGFFNYAARDVYGMRAALGLNWSKGTVYGWDAGCVGYHTKVVGLDMGFIGTMDDRITGVSFCGIGTMATEESCGCLISGGVNVSKVAYGAEVAGLYNHTDELHGCQIGLVNYARECPWGFQIGLVNIIMDNKIKVLPIVNAYF